MGNATVLICISRLKRHAEPVVPSFFLTTTTSYFHESGPCQPPLLRPPKNTPQEIVDFELAELDVSPYQCVNWMEMKATSIDESGMNPGVTIEQLKQWVNY